MPIAREIPYSDPISVFAPFSAEPFAALFDCSTGQQQTARYSYICVAPVDVIVAVGIGSAQGTVQLNGRSCSGDPFQVLEKCLAGWRHDPLPGIPPFQGGAAGLLGYELGGCLEQMPPPYERDEPVPDMAIGIYDVVIAFDHLLARAWVISSGYPEKGRQSRDVRAERRLSEMIEQLGSGREHQTTDFPFCPTWQSDNRREVYLEKVKRAIDYIRAGDVLQVNLSQEFCAAKPHHLDAFGIYRRLRSSAPAPFAAYVACGSGRAVCSASPERFLSVDKEGGVETRPIKGTRRRGGDFGEDAALADELVRSAKDRAENLMIVDLMRNDLSKVCRVGSVLVPQLVALETFPTIHHLVSVVTGQLQGDKGPVDLLRSCFPGGSITGAPKIRAMEIIHELEQRRRGAYCGSIIWIGFDGSMDSSILIRTIVVSDRSMRVAVGGGVVADSSPEEEYEETLIKAHALLTAFDTSESEPCLQPHS
jgi:para-aminobenzoate synthetase component 1